MSINFRKLGLKYWAWGLFLLVAVTGALLWLQSVHFSVKPAASSTVEYRHLTDPTSFAVGQRGGTLVFNVVGEGMSGFNPALAQDQGVGQILQLLHAGLIEQNPSSTNLEPALASHWEVQDDTTYTLTLRRGVRWSDGEPFTVEDVLFTFRDVIFNSDIATPFRKLFVVDGRLPELDIIGDDTVRFSTPRVYAPFLRWLSFVPILPKHLLARHVARLHPSGAVQAWGRARVIVQSVFRQRSRAYVGEEAFGALEANFTQLKDALDARDLTQIQATLDRLYLTLGVVEAGLPQLEQTQTTENDELYLLSLLGLGIVNLRDELDHIRTQTQAGHFDQIGMRKDTLAQAWPATVSPDSLAGLGPFQVQSYGDGQLQLVRNPHYWKQDAQGTVLPYLDEVTIRFVKEADQALANFGLSKTQLLFPRSEDLPLLQGKTGVMANQGRFTLALNAPSLATNFIVLNQDTPNKALRKVFDDLAFRKAISLVLDRQRLIDEALGGVGILLDGPIDPTSRFHANGLPQSTYDLTQAAALLDEAGYHDQDNDGLREDKAGNPLRFTLMTNQDNPLRVRTAELLQSGLRALGIETTLKLVGFNQLLQNTLSGAYQAAVLGLSGGIDPHGGVQMWQLGGRLRFWRLHSAPPAWEQQVDTVFQAAAATLDDAQRRALYEQFQRLVAEHLPVLYTVEPLLGVAYDNALKNADVSNALGTPLRLLEFLFFS